MDLSFLPAVNATLNGVAAILLVLGIVAIKRRNIAAHRNLITTAFILSCLFLVSYVIHYTWRLLTMGGLHTKFEGPDALRYFYYAVLLTHIPLAMTLPFLAGVQLTTGYRKKYWFHRWFGMVVFPVWLYVSITGVIIYVMLYHFNAKMAGA